jgi:hypothetical protein
MHSDVLVVIVVAAALAFDFTNGFHDTATGIIDAARVTETVAFARAAGRGRRRRDPLAWVIPRWWCRPWSRHPRRWCSPGW